MERRFAAMIPSCPTFARLPDGREVSIAPAGLFDNGKWCTGAILALSDPIRQAEPIATEDAMPDEFPRH
jgi:hypothetical protein